jgi:hypothetical protein
MGDKSPKSKERKKKQDAAQKSQKKADALAKANPRVRRKLTPLLRRIPLRPHRSSEASSRRPSFGDRVSGWRRCWAAPSEVAGTSFANRP